MLLPIRGGGSASLTATADPNVSTSVRTTDLNFNANGQQIKSVKATQQAVPFFANISPIAHSGIVNDEQIAFEFYQRNFRQQVEEGCPQLDFECLITNFPYNNLSSLDFMVNIACNTAVLGTEFELYWQYSPDGGANWVTDIFSVESSSGDYEFYTGQTQSFEVNQLPDPLQIRIGYGDKGSESIDVWLQKFQVSFILSPRP